MKKFSILKNLFCLIILSKVALPAIAEDILEQDGIIDYPMSGNILLVYNNKLYCDTGKNTGNISERLQKITVPAQPDSKGFKFITKPTYIEGQGNKIIKNYYLHSIFFNTLISKNNLTKEYKNHCENMIKFQFIYPDNINIKTIISSSFFQEKNNGQIIEYKAENIKSCMGRYTEGMRLRTWNYTNLPWVEGAAGNGIGETLNIEFKQESRWLVILNGYVDFFNMQLFKQNGRVKTMKITPTDDGEPFKHIVSFKDIADFTDIKLPRKVKSCRLEIQSVYPGSKWQDTAITGIFSPVKDPDLEANAVYVENYYKRVVESVNKYNTYQDEGR